MNRLRLVLTLGLLASASGIHAATTPAGRTEDLGEGLTYVRPATGNTESLALLKTPAPGPAVLDLRYFSAGAQAPDWLAVIKAFAAPRKICLVLVSPETEPALLAGLTTGMPGCITLGRSSPALNADIAVDTSAETDRKAWDSIGKGTSLDKLIAPPVDKPRYDEAVLAKEHAAELNGDDVPPADDPDNADVSLADATKQAAKAPAKPKPLVDAVLQRAVQIDRGLLALRKL